MLLARAGQRSQAALALPPHNKREALTPSSFFFQSLGVTVVRCDWPDCGSLYPKSSCHLTAPAVRRKVIAPAQRYEEYYFTRATDSK